jgi:adenylate kinase family enzyme
MSREHNLPAGRELTDYELRHADYTWLDEDEAARKRALHRECGKRYRDRREQRQRRLDEERERRERMRRLAREADFDQLNTDRPCRPVFNQLPAGWRAECPVHYCEADLLFHSEHEARETFICDRGRRWVFILHHRDDHVRPEMLDLTELWREIAAFIQNEGMVPSSGFTEVDLLALYRYTDTDVRIPLEVQVMALSPGFTDGAAATQPALPAGPAAPQAQLVERAGAELVDEVERFLVVVHAEGEALDLLDVLRSATAVGVSKDDPYAEDGVTYLRRIYTVH